MMRLQSISRTQIGAASCKGGRDGEMLHPVPTQFDRGCFVTANGRKDAIQLVDGIGRSGSVDTLDSKHILGSRWSLDWRVFNIRFQGGLSACVEH